MTLLQVLSCETGTYQELFQNQILLFIIEVTEPLNHGLKKHNKTLVLTNIGQFYKLSLNEVV